MNPDEVLDQIDHALHDWDVSPDAMRWTPEAPEPGEQRPARGAVPAVVYYDEAHVLTPETVDQILAHRLVFGTAHFVTSSPTDPRHNRTREALNRALRDLRAANQPIDAPGEGAR